MSEALRLAHWLENELDPEGTIRYVAAAELRRLHALNAELVEALQSLVAATEGVSINDYNEEAHDIAVSRARAALAEPEQKPLTDVEIGKIAGDTLDPWSCARAIEKAHGIK